MTLVDQARKIPAYHKKRVQSPEEIELALAWVHDQVTMKQATQALGMSRQAFYCWASYTLRKAIQSGECCKKRK